MVAHFGRHAAAPASCVRHFHVLADTFADLDAVRPQDNGCYDFAVGESTRSEPRVAFAVLTFMFRSSVDWLARYSHRFYLVTALLPPSCSFCLVSPGGTGRNCGNRVHRSSSVSLMPRPWASLGMVPLLIFEQSLCRLLIVRSRTASSRQSTVSCSDVQHGIGQLLGQMQEAFDVTANLGVCAFQHAQARTAVENSCLHPR